MLVHACSVRALLSSVTCSVCPGPQGLDPDPPHECRAGEVPMVEGASSITLCQHLCPYAPTFLSSLFSLPPTLSHLSPPAQQVVLTSPGMPDK